MRCRTHQGLRPAALVRTGLALAALLLLAACAVPWHDLAGFDRLDLAGFAPLEREMALFADREADRNFFDAFLQSAAQGGAAGGVSLPDALSNATLRSLVRQVLVLKTPGGTAVQGLVHLNASAALVQDGLASGGFKPLDREQLLVAVPGMAPAVLGRTWYGNGSAFMVMAADGLLVFSLPGSGLAALLDDAPRLGALADLVGRSLAFAARAGARPAAGSDRPLLRLDLDVGAGGPAGKILGGLVLDSLSLVVHRAGAGLDMAWEIRAPAGAGTGLVKKAVRLWFLAMTNRLGLPAEFLQAIEFKAAGDVLQIAGMHLSDKEGLEFLALMNGLAGN